MIEDISQSQQHYQDTVKKILDRAKHFGATAAEVSLSAGVGQNVGVRLGKLEEIEHNRDHGLSLTVYKGQKKGFASTSDFSDGAIDRVIHAAMNIAQHTQEDEYSGLADPADLATHCPDLSLYHFDPISIEASIQLATETERLAMAEDKRISNSDGAGVSCYFGVRVYGNSHGFLQAYPSSRFGLNCTLIAQEDGNMQRDGSYTVARNKNDLWSIERVAKDAAEQTLSHLGARQIQTTEVPVVFRYDAASGLIGHFLSAISGGALYRKQSFLVDSLGERIFPDFISIDDDPTLQKGLASSPFDAEGVATQKRHLVDEGIVQGYLLSSYSARRLGMQTTGNAGGSHNITVAKQNYSLPDLLKQMGTGLLVTDLIGQGVNLITGDYSRGANGFWVEGGEITHPVEEITIASNLKEMYQSIQAIGNDHDDRSSFRCGSILINKMMIAGS